MKIIKISSQKTIFYQKISNMFLNLKNNILFIETQKKNCFLKTMLKQTLNFISHSLSYSFSFLE